MRAPAEVRLERLEKLIQRVSYESEQGGIIIVEGTRDRDSLRELGISGTILCLQSSRKNTVGFVEELDARRKVIVLTDFDRQGVFLAKRLARSLNYQKIHPNLVLWRELRGLTRSDVRSIEELPKFHNRLRAEVFFGSTSAGREYEIRYLPGRERERGKFRRKGRLWLPV
jgi:5S rRNA maturation endonuclease (ribonuclease M5)